MKTYILYFSPDIYAFEHIERHVERFKKLKLLVDFKALDDGGIGYDLYSIDNFCESFNDERISDQGMIVPLTSIQAIKLGFKIDKL